MARFGAGLGVLGLVFLSVSCENTPLRSERTPESNATRQFLTAPTGAMVTGRRNFTLTRLTDGRVLAVGGTLDIGAAELYDPTTATWTATGALNVPRSSHHAVLLTSGRVLISGGTSALLDPPDEIFDPATGTFTVAGPNVGPHTFTVRLADGRVLEAQSGGASRLFDENTGTFSATASMSISHAGGAAVLLDDGRVLVVGGTSGTASVEAYSPATGTWSALAPTSLPRAYGTAIKLPGGSVLLVNGDSGSLGTPTTRCDLYNPVTNSWTVFNSRRATRKALLGLSSQGTVYSFSGGTEGSPSPEVIDPGSLSARTLAPLISGHPLGAIAELAPGQFLIAGGNAGGNAQHDAEIYTECTPTTTCAGANAGCGWVTDDCGGDLHCGGCTVGSVCTANQCVCVPRTCAEQAKTCGDTTDGCGTPLNCGTCVAPQFCNANVCIEPGAATYDAVRKTPACSQLGAFCDSGSLLVGRAGVGPEANAPNTIDSTCADGIYGFFHQRESLDRLKITTLDASPLNVGKTVRIEATVWTWSTVQDRLDLYSAPNAASPWWTWIATLTPTSTGASVLSTTFRLPAGSLQAIRGVFRAGGSAAPCLAGDYNDRDDLVFAVANVPDTTPPVTAITTPADGATVRGSVTITATASDDYALGNVSVWDGATSLASSLTSPLTFSWSTYGKANGPHVLTSRAVDFTGNVTVSAPITVILDNDVTPPTVSMNSPINGATVSGVVALSAVAADNVAISTVGYYLDGTLFLSSVGFAPYPVNWNSATTTNGPHTLTARAYDTSNNQTTSTAVTVTVNNDKTAPVVAFTSPVSGALLTGSVTVTASATDNVAVTRVELFDGATLLGTSTGPTYSFTWNTLTAANGGHTLSLRGFDAANNMGTITLPVTVSNGGGGAVAYTAAYDSVRRAPTCAQAGRSCTSGSLLNGRAGLGPEFNAPNTLNNSCADGTSGSYHSDESLDGLLVETLDGTVLAAGKTVRITATVWAYAGFSSDRLDLYTTSNTAAPSWTLIATLTPPGAGARTMSTTFILPAGGLQAVRGVFRYGGFASPCAAGSYDDRDDLVFAVQ